MHCGCGFLGYFLWFPFWLSPSPLRLPGYAPPRPGSCLLGVLSPAFVVLSRALRFVSCFIYVLTLLIREVPAPHQAFCSHSSFLSPSFPQIYLRKSQIYFRVVACTNIKIFYMRYLRKNKSYFVDSGGVYQRLAPTLILFIPLLLPHIFETFVDFSQDSCHVGTVYIFLKLHLKSLEQGNT